MTQLQTAAAALCGTMLLSGILLFLTPHKDGKMMRFAVRLFFLLSLVTPWIGWTPETLSLPEETQEYAASLDQLVQQQLERSILSALEEQANEILARHDLSLPVEIAIHNQEDGGISITSLTVWIQPEELELLLAAVPELTERFGVTVTIETMEKEHDGETEAMAREPQP